MLKLLIDYAKTHHLTVEPGFKPKTVRWAIVCGQDGRFLNVQELGDTNAKRNLGQIFTDCPDLSQPEMKRGGEGCRHFLVDTVEVVALWGKNGDIRCDNDLTDKDRGKAEAKHNYFVTQLRDASISMSELAPIADLLANQQSLSMIQLSLSEKSAKPTEKATFAMLGRKPLCLVEDDAWHDWWRSRRASFQALPEQSAAMRCLASGELAPPTATHPKIEGLSGVGGLSMGDALTSFKQESFCSYGLSQSSNAALSEEMTSAYRAALNHLITHHSRQLAGTKAVHWYAGQTVVEPQEDPFLLLDDTMDLSWMGEAADEDAIERDALYRAKLFLDSLRSGKNGRLSELVDYRYYAMILSANSGRVVAREWAEGQFGELAESIEAWFEDLEITSISGEGSAKSPKIESVITCLLPPRKPKQDYKNWAAPIGNERTQLWRAAISEHVSIPNKVVSRIVPLLRASMLSGDYEEALYRQSENRAMYLSILYTRMGLLKAYHIRKGDTDMQPYLNKAHPSPAYHCGRLMAVYADLQHSALGDVGANVAQRFYAAASATPALVLGRLSRGSIFHLNKLEGGLAHWYEQRLADIWGRFSEDPPRTLTLEEQSLFALGYYQQKAARKTYSQTESNDSNETKGNES